jgi:Double zinc ribbon domain
LYEQYVSALADIFLPQRCFGCDRRASDLLCRDCFEVLPRVGRPACARCGTPTAFETFVCDACKNLGFGFESARAPLRYEGVGEEIVRALTYRGFTKLGERLTAPPGASTPSCPCRCTARGSGVAGSTRRRSSRGASRWGWTHPFRIHWGRRARRGTR